MKTLNIEKVVTNKVNGIYMKSVMRKKGWTKAFAKDIVVDFLICGTKLSFHDFIEAS